MNRPRRKTNVRGRILSISLFMMLLLILRDDWRQRSGSARLRIDEREAQERLVDSLHENAMLRQRVQRLEALTHPPTTVSTLSVKDQNSFKGATTIVVFCYNRPEYLSRALDSLARVLDARGPGVRAFERAGGLKVLISQDGDHRATTEAANVYTRRRESWRHRTKERRILFPSDEQIETHKKSKRPYSGYEYLSDHYKSTLKGIFSGEFDIDGETPTERVVILEDDLELAPDFLDYMGHFAPLYDQDRTLYAVSAWNDHGQAQFVSSSSSFFRTDFFPGLGWMLNRRVYDDVIASWPTAYWDDYLRVDTVRKNRKCIRPEISRTVTFGELGGASHGMFFKQWLAPMKLNTKVVDYDKLDLSHLESNAKFERFVKDLVEGGKRTTAREAMETTSTETLIVPYASEKDYEKTCRELKMMGDIKSGVPRGAYDGKVIVRHGGGGFLILAPD